MSRVVNFFDPNEINEINDRLDHLRLVPTQSICAESYEFELIQNLHHYDPYFWALAYRIGRLQKISPLCETINVQMFQGVFLDWDRLHQFQIKYESVPHDAMIAWIPLDPNGQSDYKFERVKPKLNMSPSRFDHLDSFHISQGVRNQSLSVSRVNFLQEFAIRSWEFFSGCKYEDYAVIKKGDILIQRGNRDFNEVSCRIDKGKVYRMLIVTLKVNHLTSHL